MSKRQIFICFFFLSILIACAESSAPGATSSTSTTESKNPIVVEIHSIDDLMQLFAKHNYTRESWQAGNREVPRITFDKVRERWQHTAQKIPVAEKKQVFFRLMAPLILLSNEKISQERKQVKNAALDSESLRSISIKYKISTDTTPPLTEQKRQDLLKRVDIIPPSLALAQAAEESGWGTSRFTEEGNAFFGQWDFSGKGMAPKQQRKELGNYGLARFDSPLASVQGYMLNVNTNGAYKKFRNTRAGLRSSNQSITGMELAGTLDKYSERGEAYIKGLRNMISYNHLQDVDEAYLSDSNLILLVGE